MSRFGKGALLMILSALGFSAMQIAIAKTAQGIPLFEQLFFRNLFACIAAFVSLRRKNLAAFGKRENRGLLVFRSAAGYAGMIALFYASGHAAQGDVAIINKMSPFVVTVLIEMFGAQNVAILYQNTDHGVIATDVFTKQYEAGGGKVIMSETFIPGQTKDFSPVLSRIKEQDPDLFYVNASYNDCAQIFMQAKALNMDCQLVGPGILLTEEFLDVVGNKIDGTIVMSSVPAFLPSVLESGELDAASKNFVDSYTAEYNEVPDGFAASAFDAVNIVLDAVAKVGTDTPALREELKTLRDYPGVSGYNMSFNEQKEMVKGIYLFEIQDGQFVRVK